jgi:hypothetical protein
VNDETLITIDFTAVSPYISTIIYTLVQGSSSVTFNSEISLFNCQNSSINDNDAIVHVTAQDTRYNFLSTHELVIRILNENLPSHSHTISFSSIFILINILATFYFC